MRGEQEREMAINGRYKEAMERFLNMSVRYADRKDEYVQGEHVQWRRVKFLPNPNV